MIVKMREELMGRERLLAAGEYFSQILLFLYISHHVFDIK